MKSVLFAIIISFQTIVGQELDATVTVNYEKLPVVNKDALINFAQSVQDYLNKNKFSGRTWENPKIKCSFIIFFTGTNDDVTYNAQAIISSQRLLAPYIQYDKSTPMLNIADNNWNFKYERNQALIFNPSDFDPLSSFLDFYAYLFIGLEEDSFSPLGGSSYFSEAFKIANLGMFGAFSKGWEKTTGSYSRMGIIEDLSNEKFRVFREDFFQYHYNGIDLWTDNRTLALSNILRLIDNLYSIKDKIDMRNQLIKVFFDAKYGEIIDKISEHPERIRILNKLIEIDPSHSAKYNEAKK